MCNNEGIVGLADQLRKHKTIDIYVQISDVAQDMILPETSLSDTNNVELDVRQGNQSDNGSDSCKDDEENLIDVIFIDYNSDANNKKETEKDNVKKYVELKRTFLENANEGDNGDGNIGSPMTLMQILLIETLWHMTLT